MKNLFFALFVANAIASVIGLIVWHDLALVLANGIGAVIALYGWLE